VPKKPKPKKSRAKRPVELTDDEAMRRLFPKKARDEARKVAGEQEKRSIKDKNN
jgi:hypothetical protein